MSTKDKKNVASQALLEMDYIAESLKNESKSTLKSLLGEAVKRALREGCDDDDDEKDEKDYEIIGKDKEEPKNEKGSTKTDTKEDVDDVENPNQMGQQAQAQQPAQQPAQQDPAVQQGQYQQQEQPEEMGAEEGPELGAQGEGEGEGEEEGWDDFSGYKVGDDTYDLTGENDYDKVVRVYKLLQDDDQVVVKKEGDSIHLTDNEAGTEYLIDLGAEDEGEPSDEDEEYYDDEEMGNGEELNESELFEFDDDIAGFPKNDKSIDNDEFNDEEEFDDDDLSDLSIYDSENGFKDEWPEDSVDDFEFDSENDDEEYPEINENRKKTRKPMKESKELIFEVDLGYTDNYQDKDPIQGLSNDEPSNGKSWHKGVPTGTKKPWAGNSKDKGDPFKKTQKVQGSVNEEEMDVDAMPGENAGELEEHVSGAVKDRSKGAKTKVPNIQGKHGASEKKNNVSVGSEYKGKVEESKQLKAIKNENKELKKAIVELRNSLNEAYITNVNLGKITKLFLENATSESEKIDIINRFSNEAKTVEQSKALYESISRELKSANKSMSLNETSATANGTKKLNEEKVYRSSDLLKTIDLMNRVSSI